MREIRKSGSMSGERKRSDAERPKPPRLSSTLPPPALPQVRPAMAAALMLATRPGAGRAIAPAPNSLRHKFGDAVGSLPCVCRNSLGNELAPAVAISPVVFAQGGPLPPSMFKMNAPLCMWLSSLTSSRGSLRSMPTRSEPVRRSEAG